MPEPDSAERALPRELSLRERYGSPSLSRDPNYGSPAGKCHAGFEVDNESSLPLSPGRRLALPRDASYLPDWVTRSHGQTPRGHGNASPRSRLGTSPSSASAASDPEDDNFMPKWVNWPQSSPQPSPQPSLPSHEGEEGSGDDIIPAAPILMAPPHLRQKQEPQKQEPQMAEAVLPRAKRTLALASHPLSLSLVHTPSMNPQLNLSLLTPVATPKGQRLFDFWHQKSDQPASAAARPAAAAAAAPANAPEGQLSPVTNASQHTEDAQQLTPSASQQAESYTGASPQLVGASEDAHQVVSQPAAVRLEQSHQRPLAEAASMQNPDASSAQPGTASAGLVTELATASRLVHQQSVQQAKLLEGLERALSELSEHRLLIQNPQAAAVIRHTSGASNDGMLLVHALARIWL